MVLIMWFKRRFSACSWNDGLIMADDHRFCWTSITLRGWADGINLYHTGFTRKRHGATVPLYKVTLPLVRLRKRAQIEKSVWKRRNHWSFLGIGQGYCRKVREHIWKYETCPAWYWWQKHLLCTNPWFEEIGFRENLQEASMFGVKIRLRLLFPVKISQQNQSILQILVRIREHDQKLCGEHYKAKYIFTYLYLISMSISISLYLFISLNLYLHMYLSTYLPTYRSIYPILSILCIYLSYASIYLFIYLPYVSIYLMYLSYLILSGIILSFHILSYHILSYILLSYHVLILSYLTLSYLILAIYPSIHPSNLSYLSNLSIYLIHLINRVYLIYHYLSIMIYLS